MTEKRGGLSRRQLFARGLVASGALVVGGISVRAGSFFLSSPADGLFVFSAKEVHVLSALIGALFPEGAEMPAGRADVLVPRIDAYLRRADEDVRYLFRAVLHAIEDQSRVFNWTRFTRLSAEQQAEEVRAWETTPLYLKRVAFSTVKLLIGIYYFEQPEVREALGWYLGCSPAHAGAGA